jgi:tetratricopeptide (TPR) repeat protein
MLTFFPPKQRWWLLSEILMLLCGMWLLCCAPMTGLAQTARTWRSTVERADLQMFSLADTTGAMKLYEKVIRAVPDSADPYIHRGLAFRHIGQFDSALVDCGRAIRCDSSNTLAFFVRGTCLFDMKRYAESVRDLSVAIMLAPNNSDLYAFRGKTALKMNDAESALLDFTDALRESSESPDKSSEILFQRAHANIMLKRSAAARKDLDSVLVLAPEFAEAYFLRGSLSIDAGQPKLAFDDLSKAVSLGYKPALELIRVHCKQHASQSMIDSLQTFVMDEVVVESARDMTIRASKELTLVAQQTRRIATRARDAVSRKVGNRPIGGLGTGNQYAWDAQRAATGQLFATGTRDQSASLASLMSKRSGNITLDDLILLTEENVRRVGLTGDAGKLVDKKLMQITNLRNFIVQSRLGESDVGGQQTMKGSSAEQRGAVDQIAILIDEISAMIEKQVQGTGDEKK